MWLLFTAALFLTVTGEAKEFSDDIDYALPQFTELDDYDKCLSAENALYCFGTFQIFANGSDKEYFDKIENYSNYSQNYDRTLLHRGYCVSSRCPSHCKTAHDFEKCVQTTHKGLNISLKTLHTCQTEKKITRINILDWCYLSVVLLILILNIVGTLNGANKNNFWSSWCVRSNWRKLVEPFGDDPDTVALAPIQGLRVFLMMLVIFIHVVFLYAGVFVHSPNFLEQFLTTPYKAWATKAGSVVQVFYALSVFLTANNLLQISKKKKLNMQILPKQIIKRYFRIAPVHIIVVGFAATLWPHISEGPMWSAKIHTESATCQRKFWSHVFHVNNILIYDWDLCLPQTWSLAIDIQLQIIALIITISLTQYYYTVKLKILTILYLYSYIFNSGLAYYHSWKPMNYVVNGKFAPTQGMGYNIISYYYIAPWGNVQSCLLGLFLAYVYYEWRQKGYKLADYKLLNYLCRFSLPLLLLWIVMAQFTLPAQFQSRLMLAAYLGAERPIFCALACIWIFGIIVGADSPVKNFLSWPCWIPLGRLSLSVLMVHWVILETHLSNRTQPAILSHNSFIMDFLATWCLSYILAVPLTVLLELPVINSHNYIFSRNAKKNMSIKPKQKTNSNGKLE